MLVLKKIKIKRKYYIIIPMVVMLSIFGLYGAITLNNQRISDENYHPSLEDLGEPIENPTIPTIEYVRYWLFVDKTSKILYVEGEWVCGDFAVRLAINAKERNWRMYIVLLHYSFDGETGFGVIGYIANNGHAFNMIYCQDGDDEGDDLDVWYIEPQTDAIWQLDYDHYNVYTYYFSISNTMWNTIYWVNYYDYYSI